MRDVYVSRLTGEVKFIDNDDDDTTILLELQGKGSCAGRTKLPRRALKRYSDTAAYPIEISSTTPT